MDWTKLENLSLKRIHTSQFLLSDSLSDPAACVRIGQLYKTLSERLFRFVHLNSLSKIAANHFHFRRFVWLLVNGHKGACVDMDGMG